MEDISVLICDDSALMRNLIGRIIDGTEGMKVVGKAMNGQLSDSGSVRENAGR